MTRDEAINIVSNRLADSLPGRPEAPELLAALSHAEHFVDTLAALCVLKLERAQTTQANTWRKFILCIEEQGLKFKRPDSNRFVITSPSTERQRDLIEQHKPIGVYIEYAPARGRCEPPPEHQDKAFHWLKVSDELVVREWWSGTRADGWFGPDGNRYSPEDYAALGWRYIAPCQPPKMEG